MLAHDVGRDCGNPLQEAIHRQRDESECECTERGYGTNPMLAEYGIYALECTATQNAALDALVTDTAGCAAVLEDWRDETSELPSDSQVQ